MGSDSVIELPVVASACCGPTAEGLSDDAAAEVARLFKALADPTRVRLLSLVASDPDGEACVCDLVEPVGLSQPTVSHHMAVLVKAGLVSREQRGKWAYFAVTPTAEAALAHATSSVLGAAG